MIGEVRVAFKKKDRDKHHSRKMSVADENHGVNGAREEGVLVSAGGGVSSSVEASESEVKSQGGAMPGSPTVLASTPDQAPTAPKTRLGEQLIGSRLITTDQLEQALQMQTESGGRLGEVLVSIGALDEQALETRDRVLLAALLDLFA